MVGSTVIVIVQGCITFTVSRCTFFYGSSSCRQAALFEHHALSHSIQFLQPSSLSINSSHLFPSLPMCILGKCSSLPIFFHSRMHSCKRLEWSTPEKRKTWMVVLIIAYHNDIPLGRSGIAFSLLVCFWLGWTIRWTG